MKIFRLRIIFALICCAFTLSGCVSTIVMVGRMYPSVGLEKRVRLKHPETGREVVIIGMIDVEKPEFFGEIRQYLDSVKREGYVVFYEGIERYDDDDDPARLDTVRRKLRRVEGTNPDHYYDKISLPKRYELQSIEVLGLTTDRDFNVDMTIDEMVTEYERRYGEIVLTDYDWQTGLGEKYKRRKSGKQEYSSYDMERTIRDDYITEEALNSPHEKIVLLYGASHWFSLYPPFMDAGYEVVEGKPYPSYKPKEDE